MKPLLIVNPASSGGHTGRIWAELRRPIEDALGPCEVEFTKKSGHAIDIAREAKGFDRVVAIGGDGTFSEVAAGVIDGGHSAAVGLIHQGTGGDFRKTLGFEHRLDTYLGAIGRANTRDVDAARVEYTGHDGQRHSRPFVNIASLGMGGLVDKYVGESSRVLGPKLTYLKASVKALATVAVGQLVCDFELDGKTTTVRLPTRILAICNGRFFGGGMQIAPMAQIDDGILEVVIFSGAHRVPLLGTMGAIYSGDHLKRAGVEHYRASTITVRMENESESDRFLLDVDGECLGRAPLKITVLPKALRVLA